MTIADSDLYLDFRAAGNENPYVNSSVDTFGNGIKIETNKIKSTTGTSGIVLNEAITGQVSAECVVAVADGDSQGVALLDADGDGWWLRANWSEVRIRAVTAYVPAGSSLTSDSPGITAGDSFLIEQVGGEIVIYQNGVEVNSVSDGGATGLRPAYICVWGNSNNSGSNQLGFNYLAAPTAPTINPTGTDTDLINGTSADVVFSGLTSDPASIEVVWDNGVDSAISSTQADFSLGTVTDGAATATVTATIGNLPYTDATYLTADYSYLVTCADDSEITLDTLTISPEAGRDFITLASPLNDSTSIIPSETLATGEQIEYPTTVSGDTFTVNADGSFNVVYAGSPQELTFNLGYWDGSTWYTIATTLNISGEVVSGGGLTRVGLTRIGLTAAGLTAVGL